MIEPNEKPCVRLIGEDGNAFAILGKVKGALLKAGADKDYVAEYMQKATSGDYDHLIRITTEYVNIQ
jgi:hypothetical protein